MKNIIILFAVMVMTMVTATTNNTDTVSSEDTHTRLLSLSQPSGGGCSRISNSQECDDQLNCEWRRGMCRRDQSGGSYGSYCGTRTYRQCRPERGCEWRNGKCRQYDWDEGSSGTRCSSILKSGPCNAKRNCYWYNHRCHRNYGGSSGSYCGTLTYQQCHPELGCEWRSGKCRQYDWDEGSSGTRCSRINNPRRCNRTRTCEWRNHRCRRDNGGSSGGGCRWISYKGRMRCIRRIYD